MGPLISCVMLVRWPERAAMIADALRAFELQTWPWRELVVVNDGAPVVASPGIRVVNLGTRMSIGSKRNIGAEVATGSWLATWDDDDFALPEHLASQLRVAAAGTPVDQVKSSGEWVADKDLRVLFRIHGVCYATSITSREAVMRACYPDISWREDMELAIRLHMRGYRTRDAAPVTYVHRRHDINASLALAGETLQRYAERAVSDDVAGINERLSRLRREPVKLWIRGA